MSISDFHDPEKFRQSLHNLAEGSQSDFNKALENLSPGGEDATENIAELIFARKNLLSKSDIGTLLKVEKNLVASGASLENLSLKKISALCMDLIGDTSKIKSTAKINALFTHCPFEERAYIADQLTALPTDQRSVICKILSELPQSDRSWSTVERALDLIKDITDGDGRTAILEIISEIPQEQRADVCKFAAPLLNGIKNGSQRAKILETISEIPQEQRENVCKFATPLLEDIIDGYGRAAILEALSNIPPEKREEVCKFATPLLTDIPYGNGRAAILKSISKIPQDQRVSVIKLALPLLKDITDTSQRKKILDIISTLSQEQRVEILETISNFPQEQQADVLTSAMPLLAAITDDSQRLKILRIIRDLPQEQRVSVIKIALVFIKGVKDETQQTKMFLAISQLPQEQRDPKIIEKLVPFLKDPKTYEYPPWQNILIAIKQLPASYAIGPNIDQTQILNKFKQFFTLLNRDVVPTLLAVDVTKLDVTKLNISMLPTPGHCNGFAFIKGFYSAFGREDEFFKIMGLFSEWDGTIDSLSKKEPVQDLSGGYKNFQELIEEWINDIIWFQQNDFLVEEKKSTYEIQLKRKEQLRAIAPNTHIEIIEPYHEIQDCTIRQLTMLLKKYSENYRGSIVEFAGGRHAVSLKVQADGSIDYYDPNFPVRLKPFNDMASLSQHIFYTKYLFLKKDRISANGTPVFQLITTVYNLSKIPTPTDLPKTQ